MARNKPEDEKADAPSFEDALAELESVVADLEGGELGLAASLERYEAGVRHLRHCYTLLDQAQRKIELLSGVAEDGTAVTEPFDEQTAADLPEKARTRAKRRSRGAPEATPSEADDESSDQLF